MIRKKSSSYTKRRLNIQGTVSRGRSEGEQAGCRGKSREATGGKTEMTYVTLKKDKI